MLNYTETRHNQVKANVEACGGTIQREKEETDRRQGSGQTYT